MIPPQVSKVTDTQTGGVRYSATGYPRHPLEDYAPSLKTDRSPIRLTPRVGKRYTHRESALNKTDKVYPYA